MQFYGNVSDAKTEEPLSGALVTLYIGDTYLLENTPTDKDGRFNFEFKGISVPQEGEIISSKIKKKGYKTQETSYRIMDDKELEFDIELTPIPVLWPRLLLITGITLGILVLLTLLGLMVYKLVNRHPLPDVQLNGKFTTDPDPPVIAPGHPCKLKWKVLGAEDLSLNGDKVEEHNSFSVVNPQKNTTYTLVARKGKEEKKWTATVVIPPLPQIKKFSADPPQVYMGRPALLEWETSDTTVIYVADGPISDRDLLEAADQARVENMKIIDLSGEKELLVDRGELNGSVQVFPERTTTFILLAENDVGMRAEKRVTVTVPVPPEIEYFYPDKNSVKPGEPVILKWSTLHASLVTLDEKEETGESEVNKNNGDENPKEVPPVYSKTVQPEKTTTYILAAKNSVGERHVGRTIRVETEKKPLPPASPIFSYFRVWPLTVGPGETVTLEWKVLEASRVCLEGEPIDPDNPVEPPRPKAQTAGSGWGDCPVRDRPLTVGVVLESPQKALGPLPPTGVLEFKAAQSWRFRITAINVNEAGMASPVSARTRNLEVKPAPCTVILYELEHYLGRNLTCMTDTAHIGVLDHAVSSIQIIGEDCAVEVFSAPGYKGTRQVFTKSVPRLRGTWIGDNTISSLKIIKNQGTEQEKKDADKNRNDFLPQD